MKKIFILFGVMVISMVLTACTGNTGDITPPSFTSVRVENTDVVTNGDFFTFYRPKDGTVLVEIRLNNPSNVKIKSIVINGYTHNSTKFTTDSTTDVVYFDMNVGSTLGEMVYSVDRINYLDGENSVSVPVSTNNEFRIYVYKDSPTVTRENYSLQRDEISIDFNITDTDGVIVPNTLKAYLYAGETLVDTQTIVSGLTTVTFSGLLANRLYEVKISAAYNLDDDKGTQTNVILYSGSYSTIANGLPSASVTNVNVTSNKVTFDVDFQDDDQVVVAGGLRVGIFNGDTLVDSINITGSTTGLSFEDLFNDNDYTIKVLADYDLKDGLGVKEDNVLAIHTFSTLPRQVPTPALLNLDLRENSIEFDVFIDDPTGIIDEASLKAKLYVEGTLVDEADLFNFHVDFQVNNLFANKEFTIEIIGDYDLNDGEGIQSNQVIFNETYSTLANAAPTIDIADMVVSQGYITIDLTVNDANNTLMGAMDAILYEEGTAVQTVSFDVTTSQIVFDYPTQAGLSYYINFYADYNLRDGNGALYNQLLRRIVSFTAEPKAPIAEVKNVTTTTSSISLSVDVLDADNTIVTGETLISIYLGDTLVNSQVISVGPNDITFENLLSNNEYTVIVTSDFNLDDGSGILQDQQLSLNKIMTDTKTVPTSEITNTDSTDTSISMDVNFIDPDSVVETGTVIAKLFFEGTQIDSVALTEGENFGISFSGLLSDNNYKVIFYLNYDLDDGNGIIQEYEVGQVTITTKAKSAPTAQFLYSNGTEDTISVDISVKDPYNVITGNLKAVLMLNDAPTGDEVALSVGTNSNVTFSNVYSNERYYIVVVSDYDLNDGNSAYTGEELVSDYVLTDSLTAVSAFINNSTSTTNTISFDVTVDDTSSAITGNLKAVLYKDAVATGDEIPLVVGDNPNVTFTGIDSATEYMVQIETDYDLNEITGPVTGSVLDFLVISTQPLSAPTVDISNAVQGYDTVTADITVLDNDGVVTGNLKAVLYKDSVSTGQEVALSVGANPGVSFTGLLSDNTYEIKVFADYDLNDNNGVQAAQELASQFITTLAKLIPLTTVTNISITHSQITFDFNLNDVDNVLASSTLRAGLYVNDVLQTSKLLYTNQVSFDLSGFLADFDFEIRLTGNYDLDNGDGIIVGGTIASYNFTTASYTAPTAEISGVVINQNDVQADIIVTDTDTVITGNLIAVLYDKDDVALETIVLQTGDNTISFTQTLNYNEFYSIVVYADYNLLDGSGTQSGEILAEYITSVYNKLIPQASVTNVVTSQNSITFDATVLDNDLVIIPTTTYAELYLDGTKVDEVLLSTGANVGESFTSLLSNREYVIKVVTNYDNGDGNGTYTHFEMTTSTNTTNAKAIPTATIVSDTIAASQLIVDITVVDPDAVSSVRAANLYDSSGALIDTKALNVGDNFNQTFTGLLGNTTYTVKVEMTYDLSDGYGNQVGVINTLDQTTLNSTAPLGVINSVTPTTSQLTVDYSFTDNDNVSTEQYLRLYDGVSQVGEYAISTGSNQTYTFTTLTPNHSYTVKLESSYNLNDLNGLQTDQVLATNTTSTSSLITILNESIAKKSNSLDVDVTDSENIITGATLTATLYQGLTSVATYIVQTDVPTHIDMINLLSNYDYRLEITATYDVGAGNVTEVVYTHYFTTISLVQPVVTIDNYANWTLSPNVVADITITTDTDNVVTDKTTWTAYLYVDGVLQDTQSIYVANGNSNPEGATTTVTFSGYAAAGTEAFTIVVTAGVDMNDQPATGAVETILASATGIDMNN